MSWDSTNQLSTNICHDVDPRLSVKETQKQRQCNFPHVTKKIVWRIVWSKRTAQLTLSVISTSKKKQSFIGFFQEDRDGNMNRLFVLLLQYCKLQHPQAWKILANKLLSKDSLRQARIDWSTLIALLAARATIPFLKNDSSGDNVNRLFSWLWCWNLNVRINTQVVKKTHGRANFERPQTHFSWIDSVNAMKQLTFCDCFWKGKVSTTTFTRILVPCTTDCWSYRCTSK